MLIGYYSRVDTKQEIIDRKFSLSRLNAAKDFAERKRLALKEFLKIYAVKTII